VLVLAALTYSSTHELDPHKPLINATPALEVQVVALPWKWLFIYPELGIATVNTLTIPAHTPINFQITADAPMNSFWIPRLGGQIYAMTGMTTKLHLIADEVGIYDGMSANYSGEGFTGMKFMVHAVPQDDFDAWVRKVEATSLLTRDRYAELAQPSSNDVPQYYAAVPELFDSIVKKYAW
jgi:cytochrome o ubiquinol oxidase subunit 2